MPDALPMEDLDEEPPVLPEDVRYHLGQLLAVAYGRESWETDPTDRFADLLARLDSALESASQRATATFKTELLATATALRRFAVSLTHGETAVDDLVQDTMLRAWRSQGNFTPGTNFAAWTFTIMRNLFYSGHRKHGREVEDADGARAAKLPTLPEQGGHLDLQDMRAAVSSLTPVMREALILVAVEDLTYEEAATVMGCQIGTVKSRVSRAREKLVRLLGYDGAEAGQDPLTLSVIGGSV